MIVHLGFAMAKIDQAEAKETLDSLEALAQMYEQELTGPSVENAGAHAPSERGCVGVAGRSPVPMSTTAIPSSRSVGS